MKHGNVKTNLKSNAKRNMIVALTVAPALAVMLISSVYNISAGSIDGQLTASEPVLLSLLTLLAVSGSAALAVIYGIKPTLAFFAAVFLICFAFYLSFFIKGENMINGDAIFENPALIFVIPVWSVMPICALIAGNNRSFAALAVVFLLFLINLGLFIRLYVKERREQRDD